MRELAPGPRRWPRSSCPWPRPSRCSASWPSRWSRAPGGSTRRPTCSTGSPASPRRPRAPCKTAGWSTRSPTRPCMTSSPDWPTACSSAIACAPLCARPARTVSSSALLHRPGRLQAGQRRVRPRGRRPAAGRCGRAPASVHRAEDVVARLGGDEFAVLIDAHGCKPDSEAVCERFVRALEEPFLIDGHWLRVGRERRTGGVPAGRRGCRGAAAHRPTRPCSAPSVLARPRRRAAEPAGADAPRSPRGPQRSRVSGAVPNTRSQNGALTP